MTLESVLPYVRKLRETVSIGSFRERKAFLAGLIARIRVSADKVGLEYRLPLDRARTDELISPVLESVLPGGAGVNDWRTFVLSCSWA